MPTGSRHSRAERNEQFVGYHQALVPEPDEELTQVGRGTPGGEYLRRFWHPVAMSSEVVDRADGGTEGVPVPVRILGEDLILFRNRRRELGLLHRHCSHRGTSLEYGKVTEYGIQCCYHGWHFAPDGTILETPGLPESNKIRHTVRHGAYPVREYRGLIFAYMGPPAELPEFPRPEIYEYPDTEYAAHCFHFSCNWLQVHENCCDPFHATWLHTRHSGAQFVEAWGAYPVQRWRETPSGMMTETTRRSGENMWFDSVDVRMPNMRCTGDLWEDGSQVKAFCRTALTLYAVPIDDTNTLFIGLRLYNKSTDMHGNGRMELCGRETADHPGQSGCRPPEERQRSPGDWEAQTGQRPVAVHQLEHLQPTDRGVSLFRRLLRKGIRAVQEGDRSADIKNDPPRKPDGTIPGFQFDTVLHVPPVLGRDDRELMDEVSRKVTDAVCDPDYLLHPERDRLIKEKHFEIEAEYVAAHAAETNANPG